MRGMSRTSKSSSIEYEDPVTDALMGPLKDKVFGVLVSAATFHENSILLLRRSLDQRFMPGAWGIPAGKIQPREESLEQAVLRELEEEAGIGGEVLKNLGMTWFESEYYDQTLYHVQFNFMVEANSSRVELRDGSNMDYRWLPIDRIDRSPVEIDEFTGQLVTNAVKHYQHDQEAYREIDF